MAAHSAEISMHQVYGIVYHFPSLQQFQYFTSQTKTPLNYLIEQLRRVDGSTQIGQAIFKLCESRIRDALANAGDSSKRRQAWNEAYLVLRKWFPQFRQTITDDCEMMVSGMYS